VNSDTGGLLWFVANVLVAALAIVLAYYDGVVTAIGVWAAFTLVLLMFRPQ
jgi:hypothetical protein